MKIGIDITNLDPNFFGGSDTYCNGLLNGFAKDNKNKYQIYVNEKYFKIRKLKSKKNFNFIIIKDTFFNLLLRKIYNRFFPILSIFLFNKKYISEYYLRNTLNKDFKKIVEKNSNVLITPNVNLTVYNLKIPTITNLQDVQHLYFPKNFSFSEIQRRNFTFHNTAKYSELIISSTKFIKENLLKKFNFLNSSKIIIISSGVHKNLINFQFSKKKFNSYFFFPAQLWKHKNHILVLSAYREYLKKSKIKRNLILCGKQYGQYSKAIINYARSIGNKITYLDVVSNKKLEKLYKDSFCTLCPAVYEAASLTMLEAISYNSYVLTSNIKPHVEDGNNFKIDYFNTFSKMDLINKMLNLDNNYYKIKNNLINNKSKIKKFYWDKQSKKWIKVAGSILNNKNHDF